MNLLKLFTSYVPNGAIPQEDESKNYQFSEIVDSAASVPWSEKPKSEWRTYPVLDQKRTSSCVAHAVCKSLGVYFKEKEGEWIDFSRTHLYQQRVNKPGEGMVIDNAFKIAQKGVTLSALAPNKPSDAEMDSFTVSEWKKKVGEPFSIGNYVFLPIKDIETAASTIWKTKKALVVCFYATVEEWRKEVPVIIDPLLNRSNAPVRHAVCAVDYTLYKGKKALVIEDSAHFGGLNRRIITEDFFKVRNTSCAYFVNFKYAEGDINKPHFTGDVKSMQDCLKHYGTFPLGTDSTGQWYGITDNAVKEFCLKEGIPVPPNRTITYELDNKLRQLYP